MKMTLKLNRVGMNMSEATIVSWSKKPGDTFVAGDVIYSIETEKVTQDIEATANGSMLEILVPEGEDADVGQAICTVEIGS
jgi:pyruvate/2-oxoglutarate dehydrogenase complex dihydrolipoamide acyltransferase (E2) component